MARRDQDGEAEGELNRRWGRLHLAAACDIWTVPELPGHRDVSTTMIYMHVLNRGGKGVLNPADRL